MYSLATLFFVQVLSFPSTGTRGGVKSGYTPHTKPALFVSRITPVPEYILYSTLL